MLLGVPILPTRVLCSHRQNSGGTSVAQDMALQDSRAEWEKSSPQIGGRAVVPGVLYFWQSTWERHVLNWKKVNKFVFFLEVWTKANGGRSCGWTWVPLFVATPDRKETPWRSLCRRGSISKAFHMVGRKTFRTVRTLQVCMAWLFA